MQPLHPTDDNRHTTVPRRLGIPTRSALRHPLPDGTVHPRCRRGQQGAQGHLPARYERPGARVAWRYGRLQARPELRPWVRRAAHRSGTGIPAALVVARRDDRRSGRHERLCRV